MRINLGELNLPLDDPRREKFAQERAYGMSAYHSYIAAGYQANGGNCNRMNDRPDVQRRIQEIKKERALLYHKAFEMSVEKIGLEKADIARMLLEDRESAKKAKQYGTAVNCVKLLGEMIGAFDSKDGEKNAPLDGMNSEQLKRLLDAIDGKPENITKEPDPRETEARVQSTTIQ